MVKNAHSTNHLLPTFLDKLVVVFIIAFSAWLMFSTFGYRDGQFLFKSKLWSDFGAHIPLIRSFSMGDNFPPEYPTFPGAPIRYHFLFYLLVGLMESLGINIALALNLLSTLGFALLLSLIYLYTRLIFNRRLAGVLAVILMLFNGTLTFVYFFRQHTLGMQTFNDITSAIHFTSFGPWDGKLVSAFWNLNIYTNQRHLGLSFAFGLLALFPLIATLYRRRLPRYWWLVQTLVMLLLPWLHQAVVVMVGIISLLLFIFEFKRLRSIAPYFFLTALAALPGFLFWQYAGTTPLFPEFGFLSNDKTALGILNYWWYNLGLYLILIPLLILVARSRERSLLVSFSTLFLLANTFRLSTDMINNHKFINFFMLIVDVLVAGYLVRFARHRFPTKLLTLVIIFFLTFSGIIDFFPILNDTRGGLPDIPHNPTANWIAHNTPPKSVFLTTNYFYHPASLAGRRLYDDYGYFNWSLGYPDSQRRQTISPLFSPNIPVSALCTMLAHDHINYIATSPGKGDLGDSVDVKQSTIVTKFASQYESPDGYTIYSVNQNCQSYGQNQ